MTYSFGGKYPETRGPSDPSWSSSSKPSGGAGKPTVYLSKSKIDPDTGQRIYLYEVSGKEVWLSTKPTGQGGGLAQKEGEKPVPTRTEPTPEPGSYEAQVLAARESGTQKWIQQSAEFMAPIRGVVIGKLVEKPSKTGKGIGTTEFIPTKPREYPLAEPYTAYKARVAGGKVKGDEVITPTEAEILRGRLTAFDKRSLIAPPGYPQQLYVIDEEKWIIGEPEVTTVKEEPVVKEKDFYVPSEVFGAAASPKAPILEKKYESFVSLGEKAIAEREGRAGRGFTEYTPEIKTPKTPKVMTMGPSFGMFKYEPVTTMETLPGRYEHPVVGKIPKDDTTSAALTSGEIIKRGGYEGQRLKDIKETVGFTPEVSSFEFTSVEEDKKVIKTVSQLQKEVDVSIKPLIEEAVSKGIPREEAEFFYEKQAEQIKSSIEKQAQIATLGVASREYKPSFVDVMQGKKYDPKLLKQIMDRAALGAAIPMALTLGPQSWPYFIPAGIIGGTLGAGLGVVEYYVREPFVRASGEVFEKLPPKLALVSEEITRPFGKAEEVRAYATPEQIEETAREATRQVTLGLLEDPREFGESVGSFAYTATESFVFMKGMQVLMPKPAAITTYKTEPSGVLKAKVAPLTTEGYISGTQSDIRELTKVTETIYTKGWFGVRSPAVKKIYEVPTQAIVKQPRGGVGEIMYRGVSLGDRESVLIQKGKIFEKGKIDFLGGKTLETYRIDASGLKLEAGELGKISTRTDVTQLVKRIETGVSLKGRSFFVKTPGIGVKLTKAYQPYWTYKGELTRQAGVTLGAEYKTGVDITKYFKTVKLVGVEGQTAAQKTPIFGREFAGKYPEVKVSFPKGKSLFIEPYTTEVQTRFYRSRGLAGFEVLKPEVQLSKGIYKTDVFRIESFKEMFAKAPKIPASQKPLSLPPGGETSEYLGSRETLNAYIKSMQAQKPVLDYSLRMPSVEPSVVSISKLASGKMPFFIPLINLKTERGLFDQIRIPKRELTRIPITSQVKKPVVESTQAFFKAQIPIQEQIRIPTQELIRIPTQELIRIPTQDLIKVPDQTIIRIPDIGIPLVPDMPPPGFISRVPGFPAWPGGAAPPGTPRRRGKRKFRRKNPIASAFQALRLSL